MRAIIALWIFAAAAASETSVPGRYAHCAVVFAEHMVVYGGRGFRTGSNVLETMGDAWAFSLNDEEWRQIWASEDSGPEPRSSHSCVLVNERGASGSREADVLIYGGMKRARGTDFSSVVNEVWRLALRESGGSVLSEWHILQPVGAPPVPRFDHTAVAFEDGLLIYGGCESSASFDDVWTLTYEPPTLGGGGAQWRWEQLPTSAQLAAPSSSNSTVAPPPPSPPAVSRPTPGARCAHSAVPVDGGMLVFGGRIPLPQRALVAASSNEPTWQTLSDGWVYNVAAARAGNSGWWPLALESTDASSSRGPVRVNRSDHSCVLRDGSLMVFGGLYTDLVESTIYIMKDFLNLRLPSSLQTTNSAAVAGTASVSRLQWGPAWRFDHSMVIAPRITHPDPRAGGRTLENAPLLYGGGGGMEIFADMWVYDVETAAWSRVHANLSRTTGVSLISSLLFGTVGFGLYACVIVCVFIRRIARTRRGLDWDRMPGNPGMRVVSGPPARRGAPAEVVADLPRLKWGDVATAAPPRDSASGSGEASASDDLKSGGAPGSAAAAKGGASFDDDDETEVCSVCLCTYEATDVLIRLPCDHLFHEQCVARWLAQDSSCPQCRFNLLPNPAPALDAGYALRDGRGRGDDLEAGTELASRSLHASSPPRADASSPHGPSRSAQPPPRAAATANAALSTVSTVSASGERSAVDM